MRWTGDLKYADYYERAYFNHVLANINPKGPGMYYYFTPTLPGATRNAADPGRQGPYGAFWCCYGTSIRAFPELGSSIYFHDDSGIYVNCSLLHQ